MTNLFNFFLRKNKNVVYSDLAEELTDEIRPWLDRNVIDETSLNENQKKWRKDGCLKLNSLIPDELVDEYVKIRSNLNNLGGWASPSPYEHLPILREICLYPELVNIMQNLIGDELVLHLNLTGWQSTGRDWHQDDYLNHNNVNGWYIAAWIALDEIDQTCGPFEFIPGSHKWPVLRGHLVRENMSNEDANEYGWENGKHWSVSSQRMVSSAVENEINERKVTSEYFLGNKGDVLLWHSCLQHRGSEPTDKSKERRSLIAHYSEISHQVLIPPNIIRSHDSGGKFAVFGNEFK